MTKKRILDPRGLHPPIRRVEADRLQNLKTPFSPVIVSRVTPFRLKSSLLTFALTSNTMDAFNEEDLKMYFYENRLKTFNGWPFEEGCSCTPENMAKAGFIHTPSENGPDVAMCFFCLKELEGWEPEDDPQKEHKSHSPSCHFINLKKKVEELTVEEFFKLQKERHKSMINKSCNEAITRFEEAAKLRRADIIKTATGEE